MLKQLLVVFFFCQITNSSFSVKPAWLLAIQLNGWWNMEWDVPVRFFKCLSFIQVHFTNFT